LGSYFPYLAASAAVPLAALILGGVTPDPAVHPEHGTLIKGLSIGIYLLAFVPMIFGGKVYNSLKALMTFKIVVVLGFLLLLAVFYSHPSTWKEILSGFVKFGNIPSGDSGNLENVFVALWEGRSIPKIDMTMVGLISALVAISGQGGLSNTPISNYTRDQGWGMGSHVGAIPSLVGGHNISLSHVGTVFVPTEESLPRWKLWFRHVTRDQLFVWMPACFVGLALPTMLSVQFLPRGTPPENDWVTSIMTAGYVRDEVGGMLGSVCWFMVIFCGFLVLAPSMASTIDGFVRRWVDVFWTANKRLHSLEPRKIKHLYFGILFSYGSVGLLMLALVAKPEQLLKIATSIYNFALGTSCWHVVVINSVLLPKPLRPGLTMRAALILVGIFFWIIGCFSTIQLVNELKEMREKERAKREAAADLRTEFSTAVCSQNVAQEACNFGPLAYWPGAQAG
jgi:hypothetical protein